MKGFSSQGIFAGTIINAGSRTLARILRLLLLVIISLKFGAGYEADAYFIAQSIVLLFLFLGEGVLNFSFIPVFAGYRKTEREDEAWSLANTTFTIVGVCLLVVSFALFVFAPYVAKALAPGFSEEALSLTTLFIRIASPVPLFAGLSSVPAAIFHAYRSFIVPAITALFYGAGSVIFALLLTDELGIMAILTGSVAGIGLQAFVLILILKKKRRQFSLSVHIEPGAKEVFKLTGPRLTAFTLGRVNLMIDRIFASGLGIGYVSCLTYAYRIFQLPSAILVTAFAKTLMPVLSEHAASGHREEIGKLVSKGLGFVAFVTIPIAIILFMFRTPIIQFLFQRGAFDVDATHLTSTVFLFYDVGLVAFCFNIILLGVFYALKDAVTPLRIAVVSAILNVVLDVILIRWFGLGGIALATSLIAVFNTVFLLTLLQKKIGCLDAYSTLTSLLKISLAAGVMAFVVWSITSNLDKLFGLENHIVKLCAILTTSLVTYAVACVLLRVDELTGLVTIFRRRLSL
ncbi:MAG: murein biosynthesis integral membrane protein MurJ [Desulfobacterales bacterium PC51MH44]|nr:MAG: murein biosynthesis integral membrane protein MurJ [Desulfobacterales bacterium PC51MH44]